MHARNLRQSKLLTLGLIAIAVANVASYVISRKLSLPESVSDPLTGLLHGIAIGLMLIGIRQQVRLVRGKRSGE
jgi:hypothetical protein